jgi:xanthine dehydrogenase YagT iron-sulfur-binding subunit
MLSRRKAHVFPGETTVLAFVRPDALAAVSDQLLSRLRAELRGLGAVLLVLFEGGGLCLRPDDELERHTPEQALRVIGASSFAQACRDWCVDPALLRTGALTSFVIDAQGDVRFSQNSECSEQPLRLLEQALAEAGRNRTTQTTHFEITRRELVVASLVSALAGVMLYACAGQSPSSPATAPPSAAPPKRPPASDPNAVPVLLHVNGETHTLRLPVEVSLLDALRERLGLTGTKKACDHGQCGACTVLVAGRRVNACLTLAVMAQEHEITTIEGLAHGETLHPMQAAFIRHDAFQCGFCTPGQIMSAVGLLAEGHAHDSAAIREHMSGNLCRCGAYNNILTAIRSVQKAG